MRDKPMRRKGKRVHRLFTSTVRFMLWLARPLICISSAIVGVQLTPILIEYVGSVVGTVVSLSRALLLSRPRLSRLWGYHKLSSEKDSVEGGSPEKKRAVPESTPPSLRVPESKLPSLFFPKSKPASALLPESKPSPARLPESEPASARFVSARVPELPPRSVHVPKLRPPPGSDMGGCCFREKSVLEEVTPEYNLQKTGYQSGQSSSDSGGANARGTERQVFRKDLHECPIQGSNESPKGYGKDSSEQRQQINLEGKVDRLKQKKEELKKRCDNYACNLKDKSAEIQKLKHELTETREHCNREVEKRVGENASLAQQLTEIASKNEQAEVENKHLKHELQLLRHDQEETKSRCMTAESELRTCQKQLEDMTCRFSKAVSDKLRLGNPALEDLSTINRPLRLADRYRVDLYGEVWCDALGELTDAGMEEESALLRLFHTVTGVYEFCLSHRDHLLTSDLNNLFFPRPNAERDVTSCSSSAPGSQTGKPDRMTEQTVMDLLRKAFSPQTVACLEQVYTESRRNCDSEMIPVGNEMKAFMALALELCWLFVIQDPPMVLYFRLPEDKVVDDKLYQFYNKAGTHARSVVWPALLLHSGGNVLCKGKVLVSPSDEQSNPSAPNLQSNNL